MQFVISDTSPINYLILIGHIEILPALFEKVILPGVVRNELSHPRAPLAVRNWIASPPAWVEIRPPVPIHDSNLDKLDAGEEDVLALAVEVHADLLLIDDRAAVLIAQSRGFRVAGTLGILAMAARHKLLNLEEAYSRIQLTNFHYNEALMDRFLSEQPESN